MNSIPRRMGFAIPASLLVVICLFALAASPARAASTSPGRSVTVSDSYPVPLMVADNLCNKDVVALHGQLYNTVTTTTTPNGGMTVRSITRLPNLTGERLNSTPMSYKGADTEQSHAYYAPPPYPSTWADAHWTKLVPQGNAPTMYLVIVLREVIAADGTALSTIQGMYLTCSRSQGVPGYGCDDGKGHHQS